MPKRERGGKSVIIANPKLDKTENLLQSFGEVVNSLQGEYSAAEDAGSTVDDMLIINQKTPYVSALPIATSCGDPGRFTAWGNFSRRKSCEQAHLENGELRGKTVFIQGLGSVGDKLAHILFWEGANLILNDIDSKKAHQARVVINGKTVPQLKCKAIAGAANNQLLDESSGEELKKRNILFQKAEKEGKPTNVVANELAEHNLQHEIGKRINKINFTRS